MRERLETAAFGRIDPEHQPRDLGPARPKQPRDADNLALMHRQRDRGDAALASQVAEGDPGCPARGIGDAGHMVVKRHILAQHHPHDIGGGQSRQRLCRDLAPVAQDRHAVGKLDKGRFAAVEEDQVFGKARQVHHADGGVRQQLQHVVAVGNAVE